MIGVPSTASIGSDPSGSQTRLSTAAVLERISPFLREIWLSGVIARVFVLLTGLGMRESSGHYGGYHRPQCF